MSEGVCKLFVRICSGIEPHSNRLVIFPEECGTRTMFQQFASSVPWSSQTVHFGSLPQCLEMLLKTDDQISCHCGVRSIAAVVSFRQ